MEDFKHDLESKNAELSYVNRLTVIFVFLSGTKSKGKGPNVLYQKRIINKRGFHKIH